MSRHPLGNENEPFSPPSLAKDMVMGIRFYSRIRVPKFPHGAVEMNRMAGVLGLASLVMALGPGLVLYVLTSLGMPLLPGATFAVTAQIAVGGAMAEDGLADSFDGLFGGNSPERRLQIMKDSTHGTYGVAALVLLITARITALATLAEISLAGAVLLWMGAQVMARQGALWLMLRLPAARKDGAAAAAGSLSGRAFWQGIAGAALITGGFAFFFTGVGGMIIAAAIVLLIIGWWTGMCRKLVGGYSGDLIGGLQAMVEIGLLSGFLLVS